jgi:hypothetical protein
MLFMNAQAEALRNTQVNKLWCVRTILHYVASISTSTPLILGACVLQGGLQQPLPHFRCDQ